MGSRNPRTGGTRSAGIGPSVSGLTRTQQLRQAKSAAFVREYEQKQETAKPTTTETAPRMRKRLATEPKKVDFTKPGMTKAMVARMKQAEKLKQEYERKKEEGTCLAGRRPRRKPAPIAGDARLGREKTERRRTPTPSPPTSPARTSTRIFESQAGPSERRNIAARTSRRSPEPALPDRTCELARSMNADVVQAEPIGEGPIDNIVIPPGIVSDDRTTIINIPQVTAGALAMSQVANRSIQVISETLDEQEAAEAAAVQSKLADLQQARREFVIAVANVGGNAVNIGETADHTVRSIRPPSPSPSSPSKQLYRVPDIDSPTFRVEYGRDHPAVVAAREFAQRSMAAMREREAARRMEEEFERFARELSPYEGPFEEDFLEDIEPPWEDNDFYRHRSFDPEELERFFDVKRYPPSPPRNSPPPGREDLHPDLWELEDPWYRPYPEPEMPDLIDFESY